MKTGDFLTNRITANIPTKTHEANSVLCVCEEINFFANIIVGCRINGKQACNLRLSPSSGFLPSDSQFKILHDI
jgi:hypothetical protein